jgi:SAM-dependent methyltransferase
MGDQEPVASPLAPLLRRWRRHMARPYLHGRVLDFGCNTGMLTAVCQPSAYLGVDINERAVELARAAHPDFEFDLKVSEHERFDVIAALAVLEHVDDPLGLLTTWSGMLTPGGAIVLTTPHPAYEWVLDLGAKLGLFDQHTLDEHEDLLDRGRLLELADQVGLEPVAYRRFMLGGNQLLVLRQKQRTDAGAGEPSPY